MSTKGEKGKQAHRLVANILNVAAQNDLFANQNCLVLRRQIYVNVGLSRALDPVTDPQFFDITGILRFILQSTTVFNGGLVAKLSFRVLSDRRGNLLSPPGTCKKKKKNQLQSSFSSAKGNDKSGPPAQ